MRVLVVRLSAIGDVANTMPAVAGIRDALPSAHIAWVVEDRARDLVECDRDVDEVIEFPRRRWDRLVASPFRLPELVGEVHGALSRLRVAGFDVALDFQGNLKGGIVTGLSGAPRRVGLDRPYTREFDWLFTNEHVSLDGPTPRFERAARLARAVCPTLTMRRPTLESTPENAEVVRQELARLDISGQPVVVLHPGSSEFGAFKRWPASRYATLAKMLRDGCGARILVTWGSGERALAEEVIASSEQAAELAPAMPSFGMLIELLRRCDLFIAGDTGPLHIAAIAGTPVVAIFGPKDPLVYRPYGDEHAIVREDVSCSPCQKRRCGDTVCLTRLRPEKVYAAAEKRLAEFGRRPCELPGSTLGNGSGDATRSLRACASRPRRLKRDRYSAG